MDIIYIYIHGLEKRKQPHHPKKKLNKDPVTSTGGSTGRAWPVNMYFCKLELTEKHGGAKTGAFCLRSKGLLAQMAGAGAEAEAEPANRFDWKELGKGRSVMTPKCWDTCFKTKPRAAISSSASTSITREAIMIEIR